MIKRMTLHEKVMLCTGENSWRTKAYEHLGIPSILMSDGSNGVRFQKNSDVNKEISFFESISGRFDSEEALANTYEATCFPSASTLSCSWNTELVHQVGQAVAKECRRLGIHLLLGPGMNIRRHPLTARNFEYYSEDPYLTGELAASMVLGVQSEGVGACPKHFACHNSDTKRTRVNVLIEERALREIYLAAFERVIRKARPAAIMSAYNKINGKQTSEDPWLLTEVLREQWAFAGAVISDWGAVKDAGEATRAGLDLQMPLSLSSAAYVEQAVRTGQIEEKWLNLRVQRILELVYHLTEQWKPLAEVDFVAHHHLARQVAAESIVLLKNERDILPFRAGRYKTIAVVGTLVEQPLYQGTGCAVVHAREVDIPLDHIRKCCGEEIEFTYAPGYFPDGSTNELLLQEAEQLVRDADVVLVFAGAFLPEESDDYNRKHMNVEPGHEALIRTVCGVNPNTVIILANGDSVVMPWVDQAGAIVETWFAGEGMGAALADILFGRVNPSGKLSVTIPEKLSDTPAFLSFPGNEVDLSYSEGIYVGYRYYDKKEWAPLYPFGHGLSYTQYTYSHLVLSAAELALPGTLYVSVDVTNVGDVYGKEIVQLYLSSSHVKLPRPSRELKGFAKIALHPGETRNVRFQLEERDFACFAPEFGEWVTDNAEYAVCIGASSRDIRLTEKVRIHSPVKYISPVTTDIGFIELFEHESGKQIFYEFLIEHGLIMPDQVNEQLDELLQWSFWGIQSYMDMMTGGVITYGKMNDVVNKINAALEQASVAKQ